VPLVGPTGAMLSPMTDLPWTDGDAEICNPLRPNDEVE